MSRTSLHRPRRPRVVWDRPATGTRLFTCPFPPTVPPTHPPLQALPQGPSPPPPQRSITVPHGPRDRLWKVPGQKTACPFQGPMPSARCTHPAHHPRPLGRRPRARRQVAPQGHRAQRLHRRSLRRGHATRRRQRVHAPISPYGRALLVVETAPHRDSLASPPRPLRSTGLSQSRRRCGTSAVADHMHRCRRRRLTAQPSGTFHPLPLPFSPSFLRRQVADAPRRESIPGRAGAPLLGAYPPLPLPPPCPLPH